MTDKKSIEELEAEESMFVQTAQGHEERGRQPHAAGCLSATLYFSDRPQRIVGHMATTDFVELWDAGDNSFESDPPNAVLHTWSLGLACPTTL